MAIKYRLVRMWNPVTLDGIGTFYVRAQSQYVSDPEEFNQRHHFLVGWIGFRISPELKAQQRNFEFQLFNGQPGRGNGVPSTPPAPEGPVTDADAEAA
jgi:hypothetical protein